MPQCLRTRLYLMDGNTKMDNEQIQRQFYRV